MRALSLLLLLAAACAPPPPPKGTVVFTFSVTDGVRQSPSLKSPLLGPVYGGIFLSEDVGAMGPREGAESKASVDVPQVDLRTASVAEATWKSPPLDPGLYTFLGMLDVNGNGEQARRPDPGDPVTLPTTNQFRIGADRQVERAISFDVVYF